MGGFWCCATIAAAGVAAMPIASPAAPQTAPAVQKSAENVASAAPATPGFVALARRFADAPVVARVRVTKAVRVKDAGPETPGRHYVEATLVTLLRAPGPLAPTLRFLADLAPDSRGRMPKVVKKEFLIAASPATGGALRLVDGGALVPADPATEERVRVLVAAAAAPDAPDRVTGVAEAFHTPGTLPGESESQIFLATAGGRPAALSVLRRPGEEPSWSASFGEIAGSGAAPARDTLAWYRLACALPAALPAAVAATLDPGARAAVATDYAFVLRSLGPCADAPRDQPAG